MALPWWSLTWLFLNRKHTDDSWLLWLQMAQCSYEPWARSNSPLTFFDSRVGFHTTGLIAFASLLTWSWGQHVACPARPWHMTWVAFLWLHKKAIKPTSSPINTSKSLQWTLWCFTNSHNISRSKEGKGGQCYQNLWTYCHSVLRLNEIFTNAYLENIILENLRTSSWFSM